MVERDLPADKATEIAMDEVQGPVIATTFVLAAVFVPVAFLGGMMGVLYKQFALTITVSVAFSTFVALTLSPALCALLLKPHETGAQASFFAGFFTKFNDWFERTTGSYVGKVRWLI